jgi:hypothetical protein
VFVDSRTGLEIRSFSFFWCFRINHKDIIFLCFIDLMLSFEFVEISQHIQKFKQHNPLNK